MQEEQEAVFKSPQPSIISIGSSDDGMCSFAGVTRLTRLNHVILTRLIFSDFRSPGTDTDHSDWSGLTLLGYKTRSGRISKQSRYKEENVKKWMKASGLTRLTFDSFDSFDSLSVYLHFFFLSEASQLILADSDEEDKEVDKGKKGKYQS